MNFDRDREGRRKKVEGYNGYAQGEKREKGRGKREAFVVRGAWLASFLCSSLLKDARTVKKYFLHSLRCSGYDYSVLFPLSCSPNIPQHLLNPVHGSLPKFFI
ncbi:MAG: hypothetical protein ABI262_08375 [Microcoleus sp.]